MEWDYDEVIMENVFYQTLMQKYHDLFLKGVTEGCILCVPRAGSVSKYLLTFDDFCAHILLPSYELPESHFLNVKGGIVRIYNRTVFVDDGLGHQNCIQILFEETFYTDDDLTYKVLCIEKPIENGIILTDNIHKVTALRTFRECADFLCEETESSDIFGNINQMTSDFLKANSNIHNYNLDTIVDLTRSLYIKCLETVLNHPKIKERVHSDNYLLYNLKVAVETCVQCGIYSRIIKGISTDTAVEDSSLNKILRNLSHLQVQDLNIRPELYDAIPNSKFELSKIDGYSTVLGKSRCLRKACLAISSHSNGSGAINADDVLQVLIFLIIKINLPNWNAQLKYLKLFRFSSSHESHDETEFLIASLEAAIEHIQSELFVYQTNFETVTFDYSKKPVKQFQHLQVQSTQNKESDENSLLQTFFKAVSNGNLEEVKKFLVEEKKENFIFNKLCHPLCDCPKCKNLMTGNKENILTVNSFNGKGCTALHIAAMHCKSSIVEFLLENGADPNASDFNGCTPLHYAAMKGHQNGLLLLAYARADVNAVDYSLNTPLHYCSNNGHENCVKALIYFCENLGTKLNVNAQNSSGDSPLHKASTWGYSNIVKLLLENGADSTARNKKKLSSIDVAHNLKLLELLTQPLGEVQNYIRIIPFKPMFDHVEEVSCDSSRKETVKGILPHCGNELKKVEKTLKAIADGDTALTCFYLGVDASKAEKNANPGAGRSSPAAEKDKCHPLCRCSRCERCESDDSQEEAPPRGDSAAGINVNNCNMDGFTPLHAAATYGRTEICEILLENGARSNAQSRKELLTPLMLACQNGKLDAARILLRHGCDVNVQDRKGNTALHHACRSRNAEIVRALIRCGPDTNLKNHKSKTALQESRENMSIAIVEAFGGGGSLFSQDGGSRGRLPEGEAF